MRTTQRRNMEFRHPGKNEKLHQIKKKEISKTNNQFFSHPKYLTQTQLSKKKKTY